MRGCGGVSAHRRGVFGLVESDSGRFREGGRRVRGPLRFVLLSLTADGEVYAWGSNNKHSILGTETTHSYAGQSADQPGRVVGLSDVVDISTGYDHSLAVTADGDVYAWGDNSDRGKLGDGTTDDRSKPVRVPGVSDVTEVAAGFHHSLALTADGDVYGWGRNDDGTLGVGKSDTAVEKPVKIAGLSNVTDVSAGGGHSLAVTAVGDVYAWGENGNGQLGDGTRESRDEPVRVENVSDVTTVSAGGSQSAAVTGGGAAYTWGYNLYHLSDSDSPVDRKGSKQEGTTSPARVSELSDVTGISIDSGHALLTTGEGDVHVWGRQVFTDVDDDSPESQYEPVRVDGISDVATASAGGTNTTLVATVDGETSEWGDIMMPP